MIKSQKRHLVPNLHFNALSTRKHQAAVARPLRHIIPSPDPRAIGPRCPRGPSAGRMCTPRSAHSLVHAQVVGQLWELGETYGGEG